MSRRHHRPAPQPVLTPAPAPEPAPISVTSPVRSLLSILAPPKVAQPVPFSLPALPVGELLGGVSNTVRGLVLNDNWWVVLLIIFLFFPKVSDRMFGSILKD